MPITQFLSHLDDPAPGFQCALSGDSQESLGWKAFVSHRRKPPANASDIAMLRELLGPVSAPFEALYRANDGYLLYEDSLPNYYIATPDPAVRSYHAAGVQFYPISEWRSRTAKVFEDESSFGWDQAEIARWRDSCLLFGEICHSANYLAVRTSGPDAGKIYYLQHDPFIDGPIADSLEGLLDRIVADPAAFLNDMGCYTRYSDGQRDERGVTNHQWIPMAYIPDLRS